MQTMRIQDFHDAVLVALSWSAAICAQLQNPVFASGFASLLSCSQHVPFDCLHHLLLCKTLQLTVQKAWVAAVSCCSCQSPLQVIGLEQLRQLRPLLQDISCLDPNGLLLPNYVLHAVCRRPVLFATNAGNGGDDLTEADYPPVDPNSSPKVSSSSDTGSGSNAGSGSGEEEESPAQLGDSNSGSRSDKEEEGDKLSPADVLGNEARSEGNEHAEVQSSLCFSHIAGFQVMLELAGFTATCAVTLEHAKHTCSA